MTPKTGLRPFHIIVHALSFHHPTYTPLLFLGSQRIRASGVVLLETILFGSLLLYFPVSLWPEADPHLPGSPQSQPTTLQTPECFFLSAFLGGFGDLQIPLLRSTNGRLT